MKDFAEKKTDALSKGMGQKVQVLASIAADIVTRKSPRKLLFNLTWFWIEACVAVLLWAAIVATVATQAIMSSMAAATRGPAV